MGKLRSIGLAALVFVGAGASFGVPVGAQSPGAPAQLDLSDRLFVARAIEPSPDWTAVMRPLLARLSGQTDRLAVTYRSDLLQDRTLAVWRLAAVQRDLQQSIAAQDLALTLTVRLRFVGNRAPISAGRREPIAINDRLMLADGTRSAQTRSPFLKGQIALD